jgi:hypothetical protein
MVRRSRLERLEPIRKTLFPEQVGFIWDPARRKAAVCSRRAGKTTAASYYALLGLFSPLEGDVAYIGLTRSSAKKLMFRQIERWNKTYNLGLHFDRQDLVITNELGNSLFVTGAHTEDDTEKLRGHKLNLCILDESASFRAHLKYLIEEVLEPTLIDTDGTLALIGTPSANPGENYFYRATTGEEPGYSVHRWTILENPYIPHASRWLRDYRDRKGWDEAHPIYRREWLGEWTTDGDSLVYRYDRKRNHYDALPARRFDYVLGVDLGYRDAFACAVLAYSADDRRVFVVEQFKRGRLIPAEMAEVILGFMRKYDPVSIVADHGGLGKAICEEFKSRYAIPLKAAEKQNKAAYIELMNGDLLSGALLIQDNTPLVHEMKMLQWDPDRPGKEDERTANDICDAALYAWREAKHFLGSEKPDLPAEGTREAHELEARRILEADLEAMEREQGVPWWEK